MMAHFICHEFILGSKENVKVYIQVVFQQLLWAARQINTLIHLLYPGLIKLVMNLRRS